MFGNTLNQKNNLTLQKKMTSIINIPIYADSNVFYPSTCIKTFNAKNIKLIGAKIILPEYPNFSIWTPFDINEQQPISSYLVTHIEYMGSSYYLAIDITTLENYINQCCIQNIIDFDSIIELSMTKQLTCITFPGGTTIYKVNLKIEILNSLIIQDYTSFVFSSINSDNLYGLLSKENSDPSYEIAGDNIVVVDSSSLPQTLSFTYTLFGNFSEECRKITGQVNLVDIVNIVPGKTFQITGSPVLFGN
jgi:hypothetical protein